MFKKVNKQGENVPIYGVVDERTKSVTYQGDAYTGRFMLFAVLIDVVIRGLYSSNQLIASNLDLILIVIIGGLISTVYQIKNRILSYSAAYIFVAIALFAALAAFLITFIFMK